VRRLGVLLAFGCFFQWHHRAAFVVRCSRTWRSFRRRWRRCSGGSCGGCPRSRGAWPRARRRS
jgi:hypothetical protein